MFLYLFLVRSYGLEVWKKWSAPLDAQESQLPFLCLTKIIMQHKI